MTQSAHNRGRHAAAVDKASVTQGALTVALHALEAALARPQPGRERQWAEMVAQALDRALDAVRRHREEVTSEGGLYEEFRFEAPWLLPRVEQLIAQLARAEAEAADLATAVARTRSGDLQGVHAIRGDAERMQAMLRDLLAKECDLTYERFAETPALD